VTRGPGRIRNAGHDSAEIVPFMQRAAEYRVLAAAVPSRAR